MPIRDETRSRLFLGIFIVSIFILGVIYGFFAHRENLFPQPLFHHAAVAARALMEEEESRGIPGSFVSYEEKIKGGPNVYTYGPKTAAGRDDWILITGGPYEYMEQCPRFGCLAWVIDRTGKVIHKWEVNLDELWTDTSHVSGRGAPMTFKPLGLVLLPDGSLVAVFDGNVFPAGSGIARFDIHGKLMWARKVNAHHWPSMGADGHIYTPAHYETVSPIPIGKTTLQLYCKDGKTLIDYIHVVDLDGKKVKDIPLFDILLENGYGPLLQRTRSPCDPLHLNFTEYVDHAHAPRIKDAEEGDLIVSMRHVNAVALINPDKRKVKWLMAGLTSEQHSPRIMPDGSLAVFDNFGGDAAFGGSRVAVLHPDRWSVETLFPTAPLPDGVEFFSRYAGHVDLNPSDKRALVSITKSGDLVEIDLETRKVRWRYEKIFSARNYPSAEDKPDAFVRVEMFGGYYVDRTKFAAALAAMSKE